MKKRYAGLILVISALLQMGMGRDDAQYDLEARELEKLEKESPEKKKREKSFREQFKSVTSGENSESVEFVQPKSKSDDTSGIRFKIPGT